MVNVEVKLEIVLSSIACQVKSDKWQVCIINTVFFSLDQRATAVTIDCNCHRCHIKCAIIKFRLNFIAGNAHKLSGQSFKLPSRELYGLL